MVFKTLLNLGLVVIPFVVIAGADTRLPKAIVALGFATVLSLVALYKGHFKPFQNKWALIFIGYLFINVLLCPKPEIVFFNMNIGSFWVWESLVRILIYFSVMVAIASVDFTRLDINKMFNCIVWTGVLISLYCFLQALGIDQFFSRTNFTDSVNATQGHVGGTLGHPVVVSSYLAMITPLAIYLKKYWKAGILITAILLTQSQVALGALIISLAFLFASKTRLRAIIVGGIGLLISVGIITSYPISQKTRDMVEDNGKFLQWGRITKDVLYEPTKKDGMKGVPLTGYGIGSFYNVYHLKYNTSFYQAHNEYLEILWNCGIAGLGLFLCAIWTTIRIGWGKSRYRRVLLASFICSCVCAGGLFVWQLEPHALYTLMIVGLIHNIGGKDEKIVSNCDSRTV